MAAERKDLCADALVSGVRKVFAKIKDKRSSPKMPLVDVLMSAYAVFSLSKVALVFKRRNL